MLDQLFPFLPLPRRHQSVKALWADCAIQEIELGREIRVSPARTNFFKRQTCINPIAYFIHTVLKQKNKNKNKQIKQGGNVHFRPQKKLTSCLSYVTWELNCIDYLSVR